MGSSYPVPRSVRGESRILYIFSIKSFIATLATGLVGVVIYFIIDSIIGIDLIPGLIIIAAFGGIGYAMASLTIPDIPAMGPLRKAGGENVGSILIRLLFFKPKKKIYIYNYKRKIIKGGK